MTNKTIPAISVIIPMYNAEKYIGECLDSILNQTFNDYEIIVVDDCSTDKSCEIVESYVSKFANGGGGLRLIRSKVNSGNCGTPRNIGLKFSRGEYIFFMDSDDFITNTALEELYNLAKIFDADVVHCEKYYMLRENNTAIIAGANSGEYVTYPTFISDNFSERVQELYKSQFVWNVWSKLIRRDFLMDQNLTMIDAAHEDVAFTACLVCSAKKYLRVPNIINFYRVRADSISHERIGVEKTIRKYCKGVFQSFNYIEKFLSRQEFFIQNPAEKYIVLEVVVREFIQYILNIYAQVPTFQLYDIVRDELEKIDDKTALTAFLFNQMTFFNVHLVWQQNFIQQQQAEIQQLQK